LNAEENQTAQKRTLPGIKRRRALRKKEERLGMKPV